MPNPSEKTEKGADDIELIRRLLADGKTSREIKTATGFSLSTISKYAQIIEATGDRLCESVLETEGDKGTYQGVTDKPIKSEEDALVAFKIDRSVWKVKKMAVSAWTVGMKVKAGEKRPDKVIQTQQYRVKLDLERVLPKALHEAADAVYERMKEYAPKYKAAPVRTSRDGHLMVFGVVDHHFGKLAWSAETGDNYDLKIARTLHDNAVTDAIAKLRGRKLERVVVLVGNDGIHIDNTKLTTERGTPQDVDGRYWKVVDEYTEAMFQAVETLAKLAPVDVLWVKGNHDPTVSGHVARVLAARFHRHKGVRVDLSPKSRKYYSWKKTLIGFAHGDKSKPEKYPNLMASESPKLWAEAVCREWLMGHVHRSRKWVSQDTDTFEGTTVRYLPSLSGTDLWHFDEGFVSSKKLGEIFFYDENGYSGHECVHARTG